MKNREKILEVTQEKYDEAMKKGWTEDDILPVGKHHFRRVLPDRVIKPKDAKVKISLYLDGDILEYFRQRAAPTNAAPYQTQINNELRRVMENNSTEAASLENDILNNEEFLRALKEKLETI